MHTTNPTHSVETLTACLLRVVQRTVWAASENFRALNTEHWAPYLQLRSETLLEELAHEYGLHGTAATIRHEVWYFDTDDLTETIEAALEGDLRDPSTAARAGAALDRALTPKPLFYRTPVGTTYRKGLFGR